MFNATLVDAVEAYPPTAYEDGMEAFDCGYTDCPHDEGDADFDAWWEGWHTAEELEANGA